MLRVDQLSFRYPGQEAPYLFSMTAEAGDVTAVSGASGSGKSTLFDLLAGFLTPTGGSVDLDGQDLLPLPPEKRPLSLLLQSDNLFDHLTAGSNTALGLKSGEDKQEIRKKTAGVLAEVGLPGIADQRASTLSGGQKQRVALARTLLRDRPILLLDEPFSALDDDSRTAVRDLVATLTKRHGWHTILVSHHADDIAKLAARRYLLRDGQLALTPTP